MSLIIQCLISLSCCYIQNTFALPANEWHKNIKLGKEYYYYTNCTAEKSNMIDKCIELEGTTMASIPSLNASKWFQNQLITEPPLNDGACTGNIAFGGSEKALTASWSWLNGDSWDDTIINWSDGCGTQGIPRVFGPDHVLYMNYTSKLFCDASIKDHYSIICERNIITTQQPSSNPTSNPTTFEGIGITPSSTDESNQANIYLSIFIIVCIIGIIIAGCIILYFIVRNAKTDKDQEQDIDTDNTTRINSPSQDFTHHNDNGQHLEGEGRENRQDSKLKVTDMKISHRNVASSSLSDIEAIPAPGSQIGNKMEIMGKSANDHESEFFNNDQGISYPNLNGENMITIGAIDDGSGGEDDALPMNSRTPESCFDTAGFIQ